VRGSSAVVAVGDEEAAVEVVGELDPRPGSLLSVGAVDCVAGAGAALEPLELEPEELEPDEDEPLLDEPCDEPEPLDWVVFVPLLAGPNGSEYWSSPAPP
jgi:hypothetical protein